MDTFLSNESISFTINFNDNDGEAFAPNENSVFATLRDSAGQKLGGFTDVLIPTTQLDTRVVVNIPSLHNTTTSRFERRTLTIKAEHPKYEWIKSYTYLLHPWLNHSVSPSDVVKYIGAELSELPVSTKDILEVYISIEDELTQDVMDTALATIGTKQLAAERLIVSKTVLSLLPSLRQRHLTKKQDGQMKIERDGIDVDKLKKRAEAEYINAVNIVSDKSFSPNLYLGFAVTNDPFTGQ